jgi:hypothetical protein
MTSRRRAAASRLLPFSMSVRVLWLPRATAAALSCAAGAGSVGSLPPGIAAAALGVSEEDWAVLLGRVEDQGRGKPRPFLLHPAYRESGISRFYPPAGANRRVLGKIIAAQRGMRLYVIRKAPQLWQWNPVPRR